MCDPVSATLGGGMALGKGMEMMGLVPKIPQMPPLPAPAAPPQAPKVADQRASRTAAAYAGGSGPAAGPTNTSGPAGVSSTMLNLGKNNLLGL